MAGGKATLRSVKKADVKGLKAARAATTMTSEQWKKLNVGMKEKWPQPDYMMSDHPEGKGQASYRDETFELVTRFKMETKITYRPHAKAPGSKSHVRYESYSKSRTVGEALKNGSWPVDWCWDIERGYIKVIGPLREEPLDVSEMNDKDMSKLTEVDLCVLQWYKKELAKKYGFSYKDLCSEPGAGESVIMRAHRLVAQREAKKMLVKKQAITDDDIFKILGYWGFARNATRLNVMQKDVTWVWSDTLGLLRDRCGDIHLTKSTYAYPEVVEVMARWLKDRLHSQGMEAKDFKWTSFNVNKNYAGAIHRDGNNFGPSMISAFGDFTGGALNYYPHDDGKIDLQKLQKTTLHKADKLDLKNGLALFNGNNAHHVDDFEGNRYSIVYFTLGCHAKMKDSDRKKLESMSVATPKPDECPYKIICPPRGERFKSRYGSVPTPQGVRKIVKELPASRYWKKTALNGKKRKA